MKGESLLPSPYGIRSDKYLEFRPHNLGFVNDRIKKAGKFHFEKNTKVPLVVIKRLLEKSISIVENTEEYTEYLLLNTFGEKNSYQKIPPGTIRIFSQNLFCFFNGRYWRKLK